MLYWKRGGRGGVWMNWSAELGDIRGEEGDQR
jgi:hypothetical protein